MAKRLSKQRRAAALNRTLVVQRAKAHDDSHLLQQGNVKSGMNRPAMAQVMQAPRTVSVEGRGELKDRKLSQRATPRPDWAWDYTKAKGYKPAGE